MINNDDFNKKIILELTTEYKKDYRKASIILAIIIALIFSLTFLINFEHYDKFIMYIFGMLFVILFFYYTLIVNIKIVIDKGIITKYNGFKIKTVIGKLSDITTFSTFDEKAIVYKNKYQKMFSFNYKISKVHKAFYQYLINNFNEEIPIYRYKPVYLIIYTLILLYSFFIIAYLYFISPYFLILCVLIPITFYLLMKILNRPCLIINDKEIIYNKFLKNKHINLDQVTKIKFQIIRNFFHPD